MTNVPGGYDPVTLNHWLWWRLRCLEGVPADFQTLFENVMKRVDPRFVQVRPYGNIGDRKCDGLYFHEGAVFQVYSPDELKQAQVEAKIEEDLTGAVTHWRDHLKKWVFVYNARRGLAPDIPAMLQRQQARHPGVAIEALSSDALWEMARGLTLQQRSEILGPPTGYDPLFMVGNAGSDATAAFRDGRVLIVQDVMGPIDLGAVVAAIRPDVPLGPPVFLRPAPGDWAAAVEYQRQSVAEAVAKSRGLRPRFAVFSLAPIPLAIYLGFALSDRVDATAYQFHRHRRSWGWDEQESATADLGIAVSGLPDAAVPGTPDAVVRVSLSARVAPEDSAAVVPGAELQIDLGVDDTDVLWLRSPEQLTELSRHFHAVLKRLRERVPGCSHIHLFYAGPTGGAIVLGQAVNPRMNPPVALYEYSRQRDPRYEHVVTLAGDAA
jgi:hypothetical protein